MRLNPKASLLCLALYPMIGWGVDLQPNDIVAPLPDKNFVMVSYYDTENTTFYKNGSVVSTKPYGNPVIDVPSVNLRVTHTYAIDNLPMVSYVQLPYGTVSPAGSLSSYTHIHPHKFFKGLAPIYT